MIGKRMALLGLLALIAAGSVFAAGNKEYPSQNINVIVQYSAGGGTDLSVRGVLEATAGKLPSGVNFAVSNVTGGAGLIGLNQVVNSPSDGYTLGVLNTDLVINYCLGRTKISVEDFKPIACALLDPFVVIIDAKAEYKTFDDFIKYAKAHPNELVMGDTGIGAAPSLAILAIENQFGVKFKKISYGGSVDCVTAIAGGHIQATVAQAVNAASQVAAKNLAIIASLSKDRTTTYPNVPTVKEIYPDANLVMPGFCIISAKADVDDKKVEYLRNILQPAVASETYGATLKKNGYADCEHERG